MKNKEQLIREIEKAQKQTKKLEKELECLKSEIYDMEYDLYNMGLVQCCGCGNWLNVEEANVRVVEITLYEDRLRRFCVSGYCKKCEEKYEW